ncbi:hypothetical protein NUSPORA_01938 [Nucleospora cyclopteri]
MIKDLTSYFKVYSNQYKLFNRIIKELKIDYIKNTKYNSKCIFCNNSVNEKVCKLCLKRIHSQNEFVLLNKHEHFINEITFLKVLNEYNTINKPLKKEIKYRKTHKDINCFFQNIIHDLYDQINSALTNFLFSYEIIDENTIKEDKLDINSFKIINEAVYLVDYENNEEYFTIKKSGLKNVFYRDIYTILSNFKVKEELLRTREFFYNRNQYKIRVINEEIDRNTKNFADAIENEEFDDLKVFIDINNQLLDMKKSLMKKQQKWFNNITFI